MGRAEDSLGSTAVQRQNLTIDPLALVTSEEANSFRDVSWEAITRQGAGMRSHLEKSK